MKNIFFSAAVAVFLCACANNANMAQNEQISDEELMKTCDTSCEQIAGKMYVENNRVSMNFGCNTFFGEIKFITANTVAFEHLASTKMYCAGPAQKLEDAFVQKLAQNATFNLRADGDFAVLSSGDFSARVSFIRR